ncbi:hypothethical protein (plasmid) [Ralstonia solanacearum CMR15]|nr:hypothethical protein [Ralstonia solanacearum CMR15]
MVRWRRLVRGYEQRAGVSEAMKSLSMPAATALPTAGPAHSLQFSRSKRWREIEFGSYAMQSMLRLPPRCKRSIQVELPDGHTTHWHPLHR